jgi:SOS-response transcriptional repressor LexA
MKKPVSVTKTAQLPRWAERISTARKKACMNQTEFAAALGVTQSNVSKWERGEYRPAPDALVKIAGIAQGTDKFFFWEEAGLPSEYFTGTAEKTMPTELVRATKTVIAESFTPVSDRANKTADAALVPLLSGTAAAGNPRAIDARDVEEYLPFPRKMLPKAGTIVAVRVKGESMAPLVNDGDTVFIDLTARNPKDLVGKMVVAHNSEGVTVKFLRRDHNDFLLVPYNVSLRHEVMILRQKEGWGIVGTVVFWIGTPRDPKH